jgi:signal transduction histidine kinase
MSSFALGLGLGLAGSVAACGIAASLGYRLIARLQRRAAGAERLAEMGTLTGGLAHEIKNPLSTISLNLQLLEEDLDPRDPNQQRVIRRLHTVQREAGRLRETLDEFLRFAGKMELDPRPTDVNALLEELADFFAPQAQLQRVQLRLRKAPGGPLVANLDPRLVKQAVLNLMINAVQAMPAGGDLILSASRADGSARIDVIDTGSGIAADALPNIFKAYYSTKKGGTGLGLAIAQRMAREHGGDLTVTSEVGKGTDFSLVLPMKNRIAKPEIQNPRPEGNPKSQNPNPNQVPMTKSQ